MQSQQKKVKWSRGETADALEERTDTGITQVSVSKMENIVADIYGNISRRPAFKIIAGPTFSPTLSDISGFPRDRPYDWMQRPYTFVFTIDSNNYVIFVAGAATNSMAQALQGFKISKLSNGAYSCTGIVHVQNPSGENYGQIHPFGGFGRACFAQSNNWGILSCVYDVNIIIRLDTETNTFYAEKYSHSAPWYAPNGTTSVKVSNEQIQGLEFNKGGTGFFGTTYTEVNGQTVECSAIDTGLTGSLEQIKSYIPDGSIVQFPNMSAYMRVEGFRLGNDNVYFSDILFSSLKFNSSSPTPTGYCAIYKEDVGESYLYAYLDGTRIGKITVRQEEYVVVRSTVSATGYSQAKYNHHWSDVPTSSLNVFMYGELLTPVANDQKTDANVIVEKGYISLQNYLPEKFVFSQQRLFSTKWVSNEDGISRQKQLPGYAVGSQIGRFNDFKNNYNTKSEAIVIDINTQYQEEVNYIADYNGIKIFTTDAEYAYSEQNGVVKQSANGSSTETSPIIFGSSLLYVDKTNRQIRALQYEFQTNLFQSNVINQMCQDDLINYPTSLSSLYDKEHHTGSFLYVLQSPIPTDISAYNWEKQNVPIAVCNFVPGNQTEIWSRWQVPTYPPLYHYTNPEKPVIVNSITVNNKVWFIVSGIITKRSDNNYTWTGYSLAELDYEKDLDFEINASPTDTKFVASRNSTQAGQNHMMSLKAWTNDGITTRYTNAGEQEAIGNTVYDYYGNEYGVITEIDTTTTPERIRVLINATQRNLWFIRISGRDVTITDITFPNTTVSVFDGDQYMWDDTLDQYGNYTKPLTELEHPRVGFMINATLESHPIDIQGKTYTEKKRIGKCVAVIRNTEPGAFTVCDKTGYTAPDKKTVNFYGCTGMKDQVRYTIKNIKGAKFTIESLTMIVEYGTLDS